MSFKNIQTQIKLWTLIVVILAIVGCQHEALKPLQKTEKQFGLFHDEVDSLSVELDLSATNEWIDVLDQTDRIVCNDSIPKITIENDSVIQKVYLKNPCWEDYGCILIKSRNIIQIHNDTISKSDEFFYPLDSLATVLRKDFNNNGKMPSLCDDPEKLIVYISYDHNWKKRLPKTLKKLTDIYETITDTVVLKIWLNGKIDIPPPPPHPEEPREFELIE